MRRQCDSPAGLGMFWIIKTDTREAIDRGADDDKDTICPRV